MWTPEIDQFTKTCIWIGVTLLVYGVAYLTSLPIRIKNAACLHCCAKYFILEDGDEFDGDQVPKRPVDRVSNLNRTVYYGLAQIALGNVLQRMTFEWINLVYPVIAIVSAVMFSYLGVIKGMQTSCSPHSISSWPWPSRIAYGLISLVLLSDLVLHCYWAYQTEILIPYMSSLIITCLWFIWQYYYTKPESGGTLHVHHWFICFVLCPLFRFDNWISKGSYMILFGIFIEGSEAYDLTCIFHN